MASASLTMGPSGTGTPRPTPRFMFSASAGFSTKKARGSDWDYSPLPRPPMKSAPPISRINPKRPSTKAQAISFTSPNPSIASPLYNESSSKSYFRQCFDVIEKLGVGSFGEVFKVRSKEDNKYYAVKRSRDKFRGESDRQRKLQEVAKLEKLPSHPTCVRFVRAWEEQRSLYIQTELCQKSLDVLARRHHYIPEERVWDYMIDLLLAVRHLHDHDLLHMDIKTENIFLTKYNTCKLGDFGLVLDLLEEADYSRAEEGDARYLAPEVMEGKFTKAADIFSLGITILEIATDLDLPRSGELWHRLRQSDLPQDIMSGLSVELRDIITKMTQSDPNARPSVHELLADPAVNKVFLARYEPFSLTLIGDDCLDDWLDELSALERTKNISTGEDDGGLSPSIGNKRHASSPVFDEYAYKSKSPMLVIDESPIKDDFAEMDHSAASPHFSSPHGKTVIEEDPEFVAHLRIEPRNLMEAFETAIDMEQD